MGVKRGRTPRYISGFSDGQLNQLRHPDAYVRKRGDMRIEEQKHPIDSRWYFAEGSPDSAGDDLAGDNSPWQFSAFALLISVVLLSVLFLHVISDAQRTHRQHEKNRRRAAQRQKKEKTDEWNEDEADGALTSAASVDDKVNQPSQPALYYPYHQPPGLQQHRHRKLSTSNASGSLPAATAAPPVAAVPASPAAPSYSQPPPAYPQKNYYLNQGGGPVVASFKSPPRPAGSSPLATRAVVDMSDHTDATPVVANMNVHRPSMHAQILSSASSFDSSYLDPPSASQPSPLVLTREPSFDGIGLKPTTPRGGHRKQLSGSRLLLSPGTDDPSPLLLTSVVRPKGMDSVEETPRVTNRRVVGEPTTPGTPSLGPPPPQLERRASQVPSFDSISGNSDSFKFASPPAKEQGIPEHQQVSDIPFLPALDMAAQQRIQPPASINLDDLHLYERLESGNVHWECQMMQDESVQEQVHGQVVDESHDEFEVALAQSSSSEIPSNDPRKSIHHIRDKLTEWTDSASSLQGAIDFADLKLVEVIGGGGFGQVWKAIWRGTPVAVKVLTGSAQSTKVPKAVLEEFVAEINLLKGMRHPNICLYMGACLLPPNRAIITELAANGSLWDALRLPLMAPYVACDGVSRDGWPMNLYMPDTRHGAPPSSGSSPRLPPPVVPRGTWPWDLVKRVICGAARGMAYLHSGKPPVLHRDLKSANILLDDSYTAKVCDFGLSRLKAQDRSMTGNCGTVQWMAPEVLANMKYNEKADVYSFGIICWELLTRQCPFDGMTAIQCALAVLNKNQRPEIPRWCPPSLHALIRACIKKNPAERPSFEQVLLALDSMP